MKLKYLSLTIIVFLFIFSSCQKDNMLENQSPNTNTDRPVSMNDLNIPENFEFETVVPASFVIEARTTQNDLIKGVKFTVLTAASEEGGDVLFSGITNKNGQLKVERSIPNYLTEIAVETKFLGLPSLTYVPVQGSNIAVTIGGPRTEQMKSSSVPFKVTDADFIPMGSWSNAGLPSYLENPGDNIDQAFLDDVNASFPEGQPVPDFHPEYLDPDNTYDFYLTEACDVWITFVHEGAGYKNVLGYYTFAADQPPSSPDDIDEVNIIFPNVSFQGSGGALVSGDKVYLGQFEGGVGIGWVLIANGFSSGNINTNMPTYYSNPDLNPESNENKRQHVVTLVDNGRDIFLIGFEDLPRESSSTDDDFNDAMFYVTANPISAVDQSGYPPVTYTDEDEDGDGVSDNFDDYPNDPNKAFNNYYPSENTWGTLAYEDLWPSKGDYDFNDMVIDYNTNQITNADNEVVEIEANYRLRAMGAGFKNGFGFELNVLPSDIASVNGQELSENLISLNANNTESGQSKAVIMVFDNGYNLLAHPGDGKLGVNTSPGSVAVDPIEINLQIALNNPVALADLGTPPYNPFLFADQTRGREIHLPGKTPTDLADNSLFGTGNDDTRPGEGKFYKTENNLPWAIHITEEFDYPTEKTQIIDAYNFFSTWAESEGVQYPDWFRDESGYRNDPNIF